MGHLRNRVANELQKLKNNNYYIEIKNGKNTEFDVLIEGPKDSPFSGYKYKIHILLPDEYPFKSPNIGFVTKIYHPNVDESSGSICLDVLNQFWSSLYDLMNVVEIFIPQLLTYPNPEDPLNCEAGTLYINNYDKYLEKVEEYKVKYGIPIIEKTEVNEEETSISCSDDLEF